MNQFNAQIDIKVMKLDEDIIQLRKGERVSAGFSQQKPQREMNNVPEKKEMFNPIIWYVRCKNRQCTCCILMFCCSTITYRMELASHHELYHNSQNFNWLENSIKQREYSIEKWHSFEC
jgi:hypothetical protein